MKKLTSLVAILMLSVFVISACTNNPTESAQNSSTASAMPAANSNAASESDITLSQPETSKVPVESMKLSEFFSQVKYHQLQTAVFAFISAYERADYDDALKLVVEPSVLESFPKEKRASMDDLMAYFIPNIVLGEYEKDGKQIETAKLIVTVGFDEGVDSGAYDYLLTMEYLDHVETHNGVEYKSKIWKVQSCGFDT